MKTEGCKDEDDCESPMWCRGRAICGKVAALPKLSATSEDEVRTDYGIMYKSAAPITCEE